MLLDFETYSDLDLKVVGSYKYAKHPSTRILMAATKAGSNVTTELWEPGESAHDCFYNTDKIYAHNAIFEYLIWSNCGEVAGLPSCPPLSSFVDVMCLAGVYAYPLSLDKAAKALNVEAKNPEGTRLIKKFCQPSAHSKLNSPEDWARFCQYCIDDVETTFRVLKALPSMKLSSRVQRLWEITQEINMRGVPVDVEGSAAVYRYIEAYKESHNERMPELTDGAVTKPTQVKRIKDWCAAQGYPMADGLGALLIDEALEGSNPPPPHVYEVLEMRKEFGSSSANKFKLACSIEHEERVHMSLVKNGATTGRYASWNFQLHNLAKLKPLEDPNVLFQKFKDIDEIDQPFKAAKSLVRAIIRSTPGKQLCVADWSGIETCLLFWFVDDTDTIDLLHARGDLYKVMAGAVYGIPTDEVDHDTQRPLGKALILGAGYGMGYKRFQFAAKTFGVEVDLPQANRAITKYRQKYPKVQKSWYQLTNAARRAIANPGVEQPCLKVGFLYENGSLWTILPSGRRLHYPEACIKEGDIQYMGVRNNHWTSMRLTPSQNIENIIQAMAADILEDAVLRVDTVPGYDILFHVHDEIVTEVLDTQDRLPELVELMCVIPEWAKGLPLFAEGYTSERFKK